MTSFRLSGTQDKQIKYILSCFKKKTHELEVRFGIYQKGVETEQPQFQPGITRLHFHKLRAYLDHQKTLHSIDQCKFSEIYIISRIFVNNVRLEQHYIGNTLVKEYWERKQRIHMITLNKYQDYVIRITLNEEHPLTHINANNNNEKLKCVRYKKRYSYIFSLWRIDLTEVSTTNSSENITNFNNVLNHQDDNISITYEVEIEYNKYALNHSISSIGNNLNTITISELFQGIKNVYSIIYPRYAFYILYSEVCKVVKRFNYLLGFYRDLPHPNIRYNQPINIKRHHAIIDTKYVMYPKYDGVRYLMYECVFGTYLLRRNETRKYSNCVLQGFKNNTNDKNDYSGVSLTPHINDTTEDNIFDCEVMDNNTETQIYIFDALFRNGQDVRELTLFQRIKGIVEHFENHERVSVVTPLSIHICGESSTNPIYKTPKMVDGLIFTPCQEPYYNKHTYKFKLLQKLTVDFVILLDKKINNFESFSLQVWCGVQKKLIKFTGTHAYPFSGSICLRVNERKYVTTCGRNRASGGDDYNYNVVECMWLNDSFRIIRLRYDKHIPNLQQVAKDIWNDINNPISLDELDYLIIQNNSSSIENNQHTTKIENIIIPPLCINYTTLQSVEYSWINDLFVCPVKQIIFTWINNKNSQDGEKLLYNKTTVAVDENKWRNHTKIKNVVLRTILFCISSKFRSMDEFSSFHYLVKIRKTLVQQFTFEVLETHYSKVVNIIEVCSPTILYVNDLRRLRDFEFDLTQDNIILRYLSCIFKRNLIILNMNLNSVLRIMESHHLYTLLIVVNGNHIGCIGTIFQPLNEQQGICAAIDTSRYNVLVRDFLRAELV